MTIDRTRVTINYRRVVICGLLAGLIIIASGMLMVPVVGPHMDAALAARNMPPMSRGVMAWVGIWSLILGVLLVWVYAAVRPRLGPGPKTAVIVSLVVWLLAYFGANVALAAYGFLPVSLVVVGTLWGLVELLVAGQIGARLYAE